MRRFLIGLFTVAGVMHFVRPADFDALVPDQLPGTRRDWTIGSGVAELATAALLANRQTRRLGGLVTAILMIIVWPGNWVMAWNYRTRGPIARALTIARLPLQIPLIRGGWRIWRDTPARADNA